MCEVLGVWKSGYYDWRNRDKSEQKKRREKLTADLATIMDLFSRRIIGWKMSKRMTKELTITALKRAINQQPPQKGLIHHSDRGSQYAAYDYQAILQDHKITTSMSRKGNCYDNACIESFHSVIKKELIFHQKYQTREEAKRSIFTYIMTFYNYKRIHSSIGYLSPIAYEKKYAQQVNATDRVEV